MRKMKCGEIEGDVLKIEEELVVVEKNWRHDIFFLFFFPLFLRLGRNNATRRRNGADRVKEENERREFSLAEVNSTREVSLSLSLAGEDFCCGKRTK